MTIVCFRFFLFKSLRWRVLESGFSLYFQSLREAYACVASAVVFFFFFFFSRFFFSFFFFLVAIPRGPRMPAWRLLYYYYFIYFSLLVAVRGVFLRGERYSHF